MKNASSPDTGKKSRSWRVRSFRDENECAPESEITNPRIWSLIDPFGWYADAENRIKQDTRYVKCIVHVIEQLLNVLYRSFDGMKKGTRIIAGVFHEWSGSSSGWGPRQGNNYFYLGHRGPLQSRIESWDCLIIEIDRAHVCYFSEVTIYRDDSRPSWRIRCRL